MRVGILLIPGTADRKQLMNIASGLSKGLESQGHNADIIDSSLDNDIRLTVYQYLIVGAYAGGVFKGKISQQVPSILKNSGTISGKRCYAFVPKRITGAQGSLNKLMTEMEKQGLMLKLSDIINSHEEAQEIGKRLHIK